MAKVKPDEAEVAYKKYLGENASDNTNLELFILWLESDDGAYERYVTGNKNAHPKQTLEDFKTQASFVSSAINVNPKYLFKAENIATFGRDLNDALTYEDKELDGHEEDNEELTEDTLTLQKALGRNYFQKGQTGQEDEQSEKSSVLSEELLTDLFFHEYLDEEENEWYRVVLKNIFDNKINDFKMARKLYRRALNGGAKVAYFYKLKEKMALEDNYRQDFFLIKASIMSIATTVKDLQQVQLGLQNIKHQSIQNQNTRCCTIIDKLIDLGLLTAFEKQLTNKDQSLTTWFSTKIRWQIVMLGNQKFFGVENYIELRESGAIYTPGTFHSWPVNLSWVLAHLQKGSEFRIISDIRQNKNRKSKSKEAEHSAFIKEICTCLKAGYEFNPQNMGLKPPLKFSPQHCFSSGVEGDGINPSKAEVEDLYVWLINKLPTGVGASIPNQSFTPLLDNSIIKKGASELKDNTNLSADGSKTSKGVALGLTDGM